MPLPISAEFAGVPLSKSEGWCEAAAPAPNRHRHSIYFRFSLKNVANESCTSFVTAGWSE